MDRTPLSEKILTLTLQITGLLTGETFAAVRSGDLVAVMAPQHRFLMPKRIKKQKLLRLINKMMKLLSREAGDSGQCNSSATQTGYGMDQGMVQFSEGHLEAMVEDHPGGSDERTTPERRLHPPHHPGDSTQEGPHQSENWTYIKLEGRGANEETSVRGNRRSIEEVRSLEIPKKDDETPVDSYQQSIEEAGIMVTIKEEEEEETNELQALESARRDGLLDTEDTTGDERERFTCSECGKSFTTERYLRVHQGNHSGLKPFQCYESGMRFSAKMYLSRHKQCHIKDKVFECTTCGKTFSTKESIRKHSQRHLEGKFECSECGKRFTEKAGLKNHVRIHTGERPYSCSECGKSFSWKHDYHRHVKVHTGERPYSCSECGKSFIRKTHLINHQRIHTGERPFPCSKCGHCYKDRAGMVRHLKSHHSGTFAQNQCAEISVNMVKNINH